MHSQLEQGSVLFRDLRGVNTMKCHFFLPTCLLLLWTLTVTAKDPEIKVDEFDNGIKLTCKEGFTIKSENGTSGQTRTLTYRDDNTGEYQCSDSEHGHIHKIYVKFRTCDNCIDLDEVSISGIVIGEVVATTVIGVAVYLIASQAQTRPVTSNKKGSDRQHLVPVDMSRNSDGHYQPLRRQAGQRDMYDVLSPKR
ncbi:T-cell surface glycoprotein CD3 gamma chain-like isoform X2 [Brachyistius frenatus]|uniref:T-cell surface glycoprotein CD3 gamma chain-like isoform X2 n=1 Tax=Brachyistius frenatus TaxID=100188 RepID=UPI0037E815B6